MPRPRPNRHAPLRVLLVDDEEVLRLTTKYMLELLGFDVVVAGTGDEALRMERESIRGRVSDMLEQLEGLSL